MNKETVLLLAIAGISWAGGVPLPSPIDPPSERGRTAAPRTAISGPQLGYAYDAGLHAFRPILGSPGAAVLGYPIGGTLDLSSIEFAAGQTAAVGVLRQDGRPVKLRFSGTRIATLTLRGALSTPERIALSPDAEIVALYSKPAGVIQVFRGTQLSSSIDASNLPGTVEALAVSDTGTLLASSFDGGSSQVWVAAGSGALTPLFSSAHVSAIAFRPERDDAAAADDRSDTVYLVRNAGNAAVVSVFASSAEGVAAPSDIAWTEDGQRLAVISSTTQRATVLDLRGHTAPLSLDCPNATRRALRMSAGNVFRLDDGTNDRMWILDADSQPRVLFVPGVMARDTASSERRLE